jgi:WD40 repeat protein
MRFSLLLLAGVALALMATGDAEKEPEWSYSTGGSVYSVATSADGEYIVVGSDSGKVYFFDKDGSTPLWNYTDGSSVFSVDISADGDYIVAGSGTTNKLYLFGKDSGTPLWNYTGGSSMHPVTISANGEYIAAGSNDDHVYLFDKASSTPLWSYATGSNVNSVAISADGEYIAASSDDNNVYLFDKDSDTPLWSHTTGNFVIPVDISADGEYIVTGSNDKKIYLFGKDNSTPLWNYTTEGYVWTVAISANGEYIAAGSTDHKVYFFDKGNSTPLWSYEINYEVYSVAISADGEYIVAGSSRQSLQKHGKVYFFDKDRGTPHWNYTTGSTVYSVAISADGEYIAAGSRDNKVYLFLNNIPPTAIIDSISPSSARFDNDEVTFNGTGSDSDGNVVAYEWTSDIDGFLSDEENFSITGFTVGNHTISFRVQDNEGGWSEWDTAELEIHPNTPPIAKIDSVNYGQVPIEFFWTETHQNYTNQTHPWNATYSDPGDDWCSEPAWVFRSDSNGEKLWGPGSCNGGEFGMYYAGGEGNLTTDSWDLSSYSSNTYLRIDHRYNWVWSAGLPTYDGGNVKVSTDNGENWSILKPVGGYPGIIITRTNDTYGNPLEGQEAFVNFSGGQNYPEGLWVTDYFDLSTYEGLDNVKFKFHFGIYNYYWPSDNYRWYINNVSLVSGPLVPGFEFAGSGISSEYEIEVYEYEWYSSIDGFLSNQSRFSSFDLSDGKNHTIFFRVKDNYGFWSEYATVYLDRCPCFEEEALIAHWSFDEGEGTAAYDSSGNGNYGTLEDGPVWVDGISGSALEFDGTDDYVVTNNGIGIISEKTLSAWVKLNDLNQAGGLITIENPENDGDVFDSIVYNETGGGWGFGSNHHGRTNWSNIAETSTDWIYLVATYKDNDYKLYRNGELICSNTFDEVYSFPPDSRIIIGKISRHSGPSHHLNAIIDEVSIWHRALSSAEISELYESYNNPPTVSDISVSPNPADFSERIYFSANYSDSDGNVIAFEWSSDINGILSTSSSFDSDDLSVGNHTISFRVQDNDGDWSNWDLAMLIVYPNALPVATIDFINPSLAEKGTVVVFNGTGSDTDGTVVAYLWESSIDGNLSTEEEFGSSGLSLGHHTITFRVQDDDGNWSDAASESLFIFAYPVAIAGDDVSVVPGGNVQFSGAATDDDGSIAKYEWDFDGDGVFEWSSTESGLTTFIYNDKGTYNAVLRVTDNDGFTATDSRVITIGAADAYGNDGGGSSVGGGIPPLSVILTIFGWVSVANIAVAVIALRLRPE